MVTNLAHMMYNENVGTTMPSSDINNFDFISPLDTRYYGDDPEVFKALHPYLSEAATITYQLKVEQALLATLEELGVAPQGISFRAAEAVLDISPAEVYEEEHQTHHNIRALVNCLKKRLPEEDRGFVHLFATSADIQDTARSLAIRDLTREILVPRISHLLSSLIERARKYSEVPQIGRTHGRYAEPVTVGYWLANYVMRITQRVELISQTAANLRGMLSGAVGVHSALALKWPDNPSNVEKDMLARLGLRPGDGSISTQVIQPEYLTDYAHALVSTFSIYANLADDYRHLMRSEIDEIREDLDTYQVGSSTMPHKVNPKNFENVKSLWKAFMPRMVTLYLDQISEHQRDLTNSASTRFFNELVASLSYATGRLRDAIGKTEINLDGIHRNLADSYKEIIAEPLYISFALAGHPDPYYALRSLVIEARCKEEDVLAAVEGNSDAQEYWEKLSEFQKDVILNPRKYVGDATDRTELVCTDAEARLGDKLIQALGRPSEDTALVVRTGG